MAANANRFTLHEATEVATAFGHLFLGAYERWIVAGSIRRRRAQISDVDHVVIAKQVTQPIEGNMFEQETVCAVKRCALVLIKKGVITKTLINGRERFGERLLSVTFRGVKHEIWLCTPKNFGCILAIRTGSGDFSRELVTRMQTYGYRQAEGLLNRVEASGKLTPIDCPDEATFFQACGLNVSDYPPHAREKLLIRRETGRCQM